MAKKKNKNNKNKNNKNKNNKNKNKTEEAIIKGLIKNKNKTRLEFTCEDDKGKLIEKYELALNLNYEFQAAQLLGVLKLHCDEEEFPFYEAKYLIKFYKNNSDLKKAEEKLISLTELNNVLSNEAKIALCELYAVMGDGDKFCDALKKCYNEMNLEQLLICTQKLKLNLKEELNDDTLNNLNDHSGEIIERTKNERTNNTININLPFDFAVNHIDALKTVMEAIRTAAVVREDPQNFWKDKKSSKEFDEHLDKMYPDLWKNDQAVSLIDEIPVPFMKEYKYGHIYQLAKEYALGIDINYEERILAAASLTALVNSWESNSIVEFFEKEKLLAIGSLTVLVNSRESNSIVEYFEKERYCLNTVNPLFLKDEEWVKYNYSRLLGDKGNNEKSLKHYLDLIKDGTDKAICTQIFKDCCLQTYLAAVRCGKENDYKELEEEFSDKELIKDREEFENIKNCLRSETSKLLYESAERGYLNATEYYTPGLDVGICCVSYYRVIEQELKEIINKIFNNEDVETAINNCKDEINNYKNWFIKNNGKNIYVKEIGHLFDGSYTSLEWEYKFLYIVSYSYENIKGKGTQKLQKFIEYLNGIFYGALTDDGREAVLEILDGVSPNNINEFRNKGAHGEFVALYKLEQCKKFVNGYLNNLKIWFK